MCVPFIFKLIKYWMIYKRSHFKCDIFFSYHLQCVFISRLYNVDNMMYKCACIAKQIKNYFSVVVLMIIIGKNQPNLEFSFKKYAKSNMSSSLKVIKKQKCYRNIHAPMAPFGLKKAFLVFADFNTKISGGFFYINNCNTVDFIMMKNTLYLDKFISF